MKFFLSLFSFIFLCNCSSKQETISNLPFETEYVYFQKWIGGQQQTGSGTNFYIQFKADLPQDSQLTKLYFQNQEAVFEQIDLQTYEAHLYFKPKNDLILNANSTKEYGNKAPVITKPRFNLQENEAVLEFQQNNKTQFFKLQNIKEKEALAYPSTKPRN